jgi:sarcosine oxidase subunit alpha
MFASSAAASNTIARAGSVALEPRSPNALVDVTLDGKTTPVLRATTEMLVDGMVIRAGNAGPTAVGDRHGFIGRFARSLPAGFYNTPDGRARES